MCWKSQLKTLLTRPNNRLAIVGIGHDLRGDDAVGIEIVRRLQASLPQMNGVLFVQAGHAPENTLAPIYQFRPDTVLFIDAVTMACACEPGAVRLIGIQEVTGEALSTHGLSIRLVADYLQHELDCDLMLLGIQPMQCELGASMSSQVEHSLESIVQQLLLGLRAISSKSDA